MRSMGFSTVCRRANAVTVSSLLTAVFATATGSAAPPQARLKAGSRPTQTYAVPSKTVTANRSLSQAFTAAAKEFSVPRDLLVAIAYSETHFDDTETTPGADADRHSDDNGYGVMRLVHNRQTDTLGVASRLLKVSPETLTTDRRQNVRGAAAILRKYADLQFGSGKAGARQRLSAWYPVVARYGSPQNDVVGRLYADEVFRLLVAGIGGTTRDGESIVLPAQEIVAERGRYEKAIPSPSPDYSGAPATLQPFSESYKNNDWPTAGAALAQTSSPDYGPALWVPANSGNYSVSSRPTSYPIYYVVIHTVQGSYGSCINWFQNPDANVSAHYVVRSSDGQITQMVREKDWAYHAGNSTYNRQSIGIEHEGYINNASWYTDAMYKASAALTRNICLKYGIPMDRAHIIGHVEVPGATHQDPGSNWNWTYYMQLVTQSSAFSTTVDNETTGRFTASTNWAASSYSSQKYGGSYAYANPEPVSDAAWFKANVPAAGSYEVSVWYPANSGYNSSVPYVVATTTGNQYVYVNQQINGGQWVSLGTFSLAAGDYNIVGVSRWTNTAGLIIADAVKITRR